MPGLQFTAMCRLLPRQASMLSCPNRPTCLLCACMLRTALWSTTWNLFVGERPVRAGFCPVHELDRRRCFAREIVRGAGRWRHALRHASTALGERALWPHVCTRCASVERALLY